MRTDSDRNLSAEADPNPARKTRERVLTVNEGWVMKKKIIIVLSLLALLLIPKDTVYAGESDEVFETVIEPTDIRFVDGKKLENL